MKKYSFSMTKKEIMKFSIRAVLEQMRLWLALWIGILILCVVETVGVAWLGIFIITMLIAEIVFIVFRNYFVLKKALYGKTRTMWVENAMLKVDDEVYAEVPCSSIHVIRRTGTLLMLGHYQAKRRLAWYPMPLRVFSGKRELDEFLHLIQCPQMPYGQNLDVLHNENTVNAENAENPERELFRFCFWVNEEKWERSLIDTTKIIRSGIFGSSKKDSIIPLIFGLCFVAFIASGIFGRSLILLSVPFILLFFSLALLKNIKCNPEKFIRKQLKRGLLQEDAYGDWQVSISESGVMCNIPRQGRSMTPWEQFSWLVETESAFYLFWTDKKHFVMILKECIESYEQAEALKRLCAEKHIAVMVEKKMKYAPAWVFYLLMVILVVGYLLSCEWLAIRDSRERAQESVQENVEENVRGSVPVYSYRSEEFDSADYPYYMPLDKQVEVLESQGIMVSDEAVKAAQDTMDKHENMRTYVEGYPYTWLLMQMGEPTYNEEWEVIGYSDEVFWFDFEGMDYITILEGMIALAPKSAISSVTNIQEDTTNVDWDKGIGSIKVSLEWNGQEYSWEMNMYYDWVDDDVLGILNSLLEQTDEEERFYATGDNGQGAIVFYCSKEWAKEFQEATWLKLSECE